ncbi:NADH-ubiquinone oxidoreductase-F iron-sulfur binding region domain-containing protein [Halomarina pelagica]|uniref:NADH-ubiquinone oxidoreductase-F iron-sulfur binding region domain-containing protein n=1 Tax=Halomarina pelagica TaxID=2961599 RepID=UPI0020C21C13|nr:NADH-ubiquinone oxidoreductase-F iron-sulfur binding region domain-containing protein [Halomarina sp. BND7]
MSSTEASGDVPRVRVPVGSTEATAAATLKEARDSATAARVVEVGPTGAVELSPLVTLTRGGTTAIHDRCSPADAEELVGELEDGTLPTHGAYAVVDHDPGTGRFPIPGSGPLAVGERRVLARCGWVRPSAVEEYAGDGSLVSDRVREAPDEARSRVDGIGLLGRGRGDGSTDEPVAETWRTVRETEGEPVVVVNANEADPSALVEQTLLEGTPIDVIDGAAAVAHIVGATDVVLYLDEADDLARRRVRRAVSAFADATDSDLNLQVVAGPDAFAAGEMTMALEALEGNDRLEARRRPPGPEVYGLFGRPTAVHTARTVAQVRAALSEPDAFDPDALDPGTRVVTVAGDVVAPATIELPTDGSLEAALDAVDADGRTKAACVGGRFGGLTQDLDVPPSAPVLGTLDLGTNGIVELLNDRRCMVAFAGRRAKFAREENCGRCVPDREGSKQLVDLLRGIYDGDFREDAIRELARVMRRTSLCEFGQAAPRPVTTAMDDFRSEFAAHADGHCPAGECRRREVERRPGSTLEGDATAEVDGGSVT